MVTKIAKAACWLLFHFLFYEIATGKHLVSNKGVHLPPENNTNEIPVVEISTPNNSFEKGKNAILQCRVQSCENCTIQWMLDKKNVRNPLVERQTTDNIRLLEISHLEESHSNVYECVAQNVYGIGKANYTIMVEVSPKWTVIPVNSTAVLGSEHTFHCHAQSIPAPKIMWKTDEGVILRSGENILISPDSTKLTIKEVRSENDATYTCFAQNGIQPSINISANLVVLYPATFVGAKKEQTIIIGEGKQISLNYPIQGDASIIAAISKDSKQLDIRSGRARIQLTPTSRITNLLKFNIFQTTLDDAGFYEIRIRNLHGADKLSFQLHVIAKPQQPKNFKVSHVNSTSITTTWEKPESPQVERFDLEHLIRDTNVTLRKMLQIPSHISYATIGDLKPSQLVEMRLKAHTKYGASQPTQPLTVQTLANSPTVDPNNVTVTLETPSDITIWLKNQNFHSITLYWNTTEENLPPIKGFLMKLFGEGVWQEKYFKTHERSAVLENLPCNQQYTFKIAPIFENGVGAFSQELIVTNAKASKLPEVNINDIFEGTGGQVQLDLRKLAISRQCQQLRINVKFRQAGQFHWITGTPESKNNGVSAGLGVWTLRTKIGISEVLLEISSSSDYVRKWFLVETTYKTVKILKTNKTPYNPFPLWLIILLALLIPGALRVIVLLIKWCNVQIVMQPGELEIPLERAEEGSLNIVQSQDPPQGPVPGQPQEQVQEEPQQQVQEEPQQQVQEEPQQQVQEEPQQQVQEEPQQQVQEEPQQQVQEEPQQQVQEEPQQQVQEEPQQQVQEEPQQQVQEEPQQQVQEEPQQQVQEEPQQQVQEESQDPPREQISSTSPQPPQIPSGTPEQSPNVTHPNIFVVHADVHTNENQQTEFEEDGQP